MTAPIGRPWRALLATSAIMVAELSVRRNLRSLTTLSRSGGTRTGLIDVVVPARDEAAQIQTCVTALRADPAVSRVIVVDDDSTDATATLAAAAGAEVLRSGGPPRGWLGKPRACALGTTTVIAPWVAFVDADVVLVPGALEALVVHCEHSGAAAASPLLTQRCSSVGDGLLVPLAWWQYMAGLPGRGRLLNGQCIVARTTVYRRTGGHAHTAVRGSVVEDAALARLLVDCGERVSLLRGDWAGRVRMYDGVAAVRAGFGKNVAGFLEGIGARSLLTAAAGVALTSSLGLLAGAVWRRDTRAAVWAMVPWLAGTLVLAPRYREAGRPAAMAALHPVTAAGMQGIALESLARAVLHRPMPWRGRPTRTAIRDIGDPPDQRRPRRSGPRRHRQRPAR